MMMINFLLIFLLLLLLPLCLLFLLLVNTDDGKYFAPLFPPIS